VGVRCELSELKERMKAYAAERHFRFTFQRMRPHVLRLRYEAFSRTSANWLYGL